MFTKQEKGIKKKERELEQLIRQRQDEQTVHRGERGKLDALSSQLNSEEAKFQQQYRQTIGQLGRGSDQKAPEESSPAFEMSVSAHQQSTNHMFSSINNQSLVVFKNSFADTYDRARFFEVGHEQRSLSRCGTLSTSSRSSRKKTMWRNCSRSMKTETKSSSSSSNIFPQQMKN